MKIFLILSFASIFCFSLSNSIEDNVMYLQSVKNSLSDPANKLSSWTFTNSFVASIYNLQGFVRWNKKKNRRGSFPMRFQKVWSIVGAPKPYISPTTHLRSNHFSNLQLDALHSTPTSQTTNRRLRDPLDLGFVDPFLLFDFQWFSFIDLGFVDSILLFDFLYVWIVVSILWVFDFL